MKNKIIPPTNQDKKLRIYTEYRKLFPQDKASKAHLFKLIKKL